MTRKFVIDTDAGVDDAQAILLALAQPDVEVVAFTTVNGNVGVEKTTANVLKVLDVVDKDIPVYRGCEKPLVYPAYHASYVHGEDGLGDCGIPASKRQAQTKHAVQALIDLPSEYEGKLDLIALGPLTNLASALQLDPTLPEKYGDLTIMGGAIYAKGNTHVTAEFNIYADPEAAHIVFEAWDKVRVLSWETTMEHIFTAQDLERFFSIDTPRAAFFKKTNQKILDFVRSRFHQELLFAPDGLATAVAIDPSIITRSEEHYLAVELDGKLTRGMTCVDWWDTSEKAPNAELILELDRDKFVQMMEAGLK